MTTKKTTTKKTGGRRPTIKDRARAIVEDVRGYDVDTREAVLASLNRGDAGYLAETVRLAERGETILDLAGVAEKYEDAARLTIRLTDHDVLPGFMLSAIMDALVDAGHHFGMSIMKPGSDGHLDTGGLSASNLARLFSLAVYEDYRPPKPGLADQISAVLKHPETPSSLYNAMSGVLIDMQGNIDRDTPEMIAKGLAAYAASETGKERGAS